MDDLTKALVSQGGFAVLAAFFGYLSFKGAQMWTADLKAGADRERTLLMASSEREHQLVDRVLSLVTSTTEALSTLTAAIGALKSEQEALRAHFHSFRNTLAQLQLEMDAERQADRSAK